MGGLKLVSDFKDYYDHAFDAEGAEFRRVSTEGPNRREMFDILSLRGFKTVKYGLVKDVAPRCDAVVIYFDETKHRGEGKGRFFSEDALLRFPDYFCSQFVPQRNTMSYRKLVVGRKLFDLNYTSDDKWRSNVGNVEIELSMAGAIHGEFLTLEYPLYAVDYVWSDGALLAVDLNVAPGMQGTGVERYLNPTAVVAAIKSRAEEIGERKREEKSRKNSR